MLPSRVKPLRRQLFLQSALSFLLSVSAYAYEVDNFTNRDQIPKDSTEIIDKEIQRRLQAAIDKSNAGVIQYKCNGSDTDRTESRLKLFNALKDQLESNTPIGKIEDWARKSTGVPKRVISKTDSIYSTSLNTSKILNNFGVASVILVNGQQIGTDKLGHFFNEGYSLYQSNFKTTTERQKYAAGFFSSESKEGSEHGIRTTNVYSYADAVANHEGQKFWERICGFPNNDTSAKEKEHMKIYRCKSDAYVTCDLSTGKWKLNATQPFTFKDYVNAGWDEAINCSLYAPEMATAVYKEMNRRAHTYKGNPKQPCPAQPQKCFELEAKYKPYRRQAISPICRRIINDKNNEIPISKSEEFIYDYTRQDEILKIQPQPATESRPSKQPASRNAR